MDRAERHSWAKRRLDQHGERSAAWQAQHMGVGKVLWPRGRPSTALWIMTDQEAEGRAVDRAERRLGQHGKSPPPRAAAAASASLNSASPTAVSVGAPAEELFLLQPATQRHDRRHRLHGRDDGCHHLDWSVVSTASMVAMMGATAAEHPCAVVQALATEESHAS